MVSFAHFTPTANGVSLDLGDGARLRLEYVKPHIVRFWLSPEGTFAPEETFVVENVARPAAPITLEEAAEGTLTLTSAALRLVIEREPLALRVYDLSGRLRCAMAAGDALTWTGDTRILRLALAPDEHIYGLGQGPISSLDLRGQERRMWHEWDSRRHSGNAGIPLMLSTAGYGLLLNTSWPSRFLIGDAQPAVPPVQPTWAPAPWAWGERPANAAPGRVTVEIDGGQLDAFIIGSESFDEILSAYGDLTGLPPLPPLWMFGLIQCRNRYRDQSELLHVARGFRERSIPADVLVIDWHWFERFGDLVWWEPYWPDPEAAFRKLREMGFRVMQAQHPFLERECKTYTAFSERGFISTLADHERDIFDHSNPEARAAWWEKVQPLFAQGVRAYWTDMGEVEHHTVGTTHFLGPRERVHNIYSTLWAKGLYEGQRAASDQRVVSLMRTAYAGIQRYGALLWSGDIDSSWDVLRDQVVVGQQVCMSGQPFWTTDVGGFFSGPVDWASEVGGAFSYTGDGLTAELYARWFQWGAFCPLFRTHGTRPENEPWSFGPEVEAICRRYIALRYRLLPYIYACARRTSQTGEPFMRAMVMDFPDDLHAARMERQFMFGPAFLVAPVTTPGERHHPVYLPVGAWYDFWSGERYDGGKTIEAFAPLERIPLLVKAGAIILFGPDMLYADEKRFNPVEIHVYPGGDADFDLYEDDGDTFAYEKGAYTITPIQYRKTGAAAANEHGIRIGPAQGEFEGMLRVRAWRAVLHDVNPPESVRLGGARWDNWTYAPAARTLTINLDGRPASVESAVVVCEADAEAVRGGITQQPPIRAWTDTSRSSRCRVVVHAYVESARDLPPTPVELELTPPPHWSCAPTGIARRLIEGRQVWEHRWTLVWDDRVAPSVAEARLQVRALSSDAPYAATFAVWLGNPALSQWLLIGPFDNHAGSGYAHAYPPEETIDPGAQYVGKGGLPVMWRRHVGLEDLGYVLASRAAAGPETVAYAVTQVWSPEPRQAQVALRGEGRFRVWWNQQEVIASQAPWLIEPLLAPVSVHEGWNTVLVKLVRDAGEEYVGRDWAFRLEIVDAHNAPVRGLLYRVPIADYHIPGQ